MKFKLNEALVEDFSDSLYNINEDANKLHPIPGHYEIKRLKSFDKAAKKFNLTEEDMQELESELKRRLPKAPISKHGYKFVWAPSRWNLGNGETRVCYIEVIAADVAWLVTIYKKNKKKDLSRDEYKDIAALDKLLNGKGNKQ